MGHFSSPTNPVFFIAEVGGNHEGDFEYCLKLHRLAIESGADAIKYQLYKGDTLVSRIENETRNKHFKKFELEKNQYVQLATTIPSDHQMFMASVWDEEMLEWINPYIKIHKVGSGDLTCFPLLKALVKTKKPIILSTGLSTLEEVKRSVDYINSLDETYISERKLSVLQCTSSYPTPDEDSHLNAMLVFKDHFDLPVGYSDHTFGGDAVKIAVAMGAEIIEKHFTDTRDGKTFRDHLISTTKEELIELFQDLRKIKTLQGKKEKFVTKAEIEANHHITFRRSVYAASEIKAGDVLTLDNTTVLRPLVGVPANEYDKVLGKKIKKDLKPHEAIREQDLG